VQNTVGLGRFACGRRKRTARSGPTGSGQSKRTQPIYLSARWRFYLK